MKTYARVLSIAGSDPSGGAGIQADLKTFSALGCYGMSVVCALTAQNTQGVTGIHAVHVEFVRKQLEAVLSDVGVDAVKVGMLGSAEAVAVVAETLRRYAVEKIVVDPVMVAKGGHPLLPEEAVDAVRSLLLPMATVVTPNLPEASVLLGAPVRTADEMPDAGAALVRLGARSALVKGGHLQKEVQEFRSSGVQNGVPPAVGSLSDSSDDCLVVRSGCCGGQCQESPVSMWFRHSRTVTRNTHGTGCTLSSAIAATLAHGASIPEAVKEAIDYTTGAIRAGAGYEFGHGHGPVHHFFRVWS